MSAAPAMPCVLETARAVAEASNSAPEARLIEGFAFYRKHAERLLRRYLAISMEIGRVPCVLGDLTLRGRMSSSRRRSFEDQVIFVFDMEKCLKKLGRLPLQVVTHVAIEDYTTAETAALMGETERVVRQMYAGALDQLTRLFLEFGLLEAGAEKLSRGGAPNESNKR